MKHMQDSAWARQQYRTSIASVATYGNVQSCTGSADWSRPCVQFSLNLASVEPEPWHVSLPSSMHDRSVLHITKGAYADRVQVPSQYAPIPDGCLHVVWKDQMAVNALASCTLTLTLSKRSTSPTSTAFGAIQVSGAITGTCTATNSLTCYKLTYCRGTA